MIFYALWKKHPDFNCIGIIVIGYKLPSELIMASAAFWKKMAMRYSRWILPMPLALPVLGALLWLPAGCREKSRPPLSVPQSGALAPVPGNTLLDGEFAALQATLRKETPPADAVETWTKLARAFVRKAREASDPRYYQQADAAVEHALKIDPEHNGALQVR